MAAPWLNLAQIFSVNARKYPNKVALKDARRSFTYTRTEERVNRLANGLLSLGLAKGDRVAVLLENNIEIIEFYLAVARIGVVAVTINFRLTPAEASYIIENSKASGFITEPAFLATMDEALSIAGVDASCPRIVTGEQVIAGKAGAGSWMAYERVLAEACPDMPDPYQVKPEDTWFILYTSGTTGKPKGVVRSHESYVAFYMVNAVDFRFGPDDVCLNVMPLFHVNSTFFTLNVLYAGGTVYIHPAQHFSPENIMEIIQRERITFISLVPTHYHLILSVSDEARKGYDLSSIKKLLCSSAPAHREVKLGIMEFFPGVELYEGYGSTEAGIVTTLLPHEQLSHLGSIGRESFGTDSIKILDENKEPVKQGEVGELYSRGPMLFTEFLGLPEKTAESHAGEWFSAGDMAYMDQEGYYHLVDRKDNMIITGGENLFPTEVEAIVASHPAVQDVCVVGLPHQKWGEEVTAVVVLKESHRPPAAETPSANDIIEFCRPKMAGYKRPKKVAIIDDGEMPRTATGKNLHRLVRERAEEWLEQQKS